MLTYRKHPRKAFSLVELVIVIVIIGVIAAIAVPRISRGAKGARDSALRGSLAVMRNAIAVYGAEHGGIPPKAATFQAEMTTYTNEAGTAVATKDITHIFGPYLKAVPPLPVAGTGTTGGAIGDKTAAAADLAGVGWLYVEATGEITANTGTSKDEADVLYTDY